MTHKKKLVIITIVSLVVLVVFPAGATLGTHYYYFGERIEHSNNYFEYLSELNPEFIKEDVTFPSTEGQLLSGAFYKQSVTEECKGLIVWVHGMGVNHENYLGEIEYMTLEGYTVFSYDNTGVNASEGDSLKGLTQSPLDLQQALQYVYDLDEYNDMPNILIGHSWGGFAVATVSQLDLPRPVDGIVSLAGFWKNINVLKDIAHAHIGDAVNLMSPYLNMYEKYIFGDYVELNGVDGLKNSTAEVLFIHSENDSVVFFENNYQMYEKVFGDEDRFHFIDYEKAGHKLTINFDSYMRIHDIMHHQVDHDEDSEEYLALNEERLSLIKDYNFDVMGNITDFCADVVDKYNTTDEYFTDSDYSTDLGESIDIELGQEILSSHENLLVEDNIIYITNPGAYRISGSKNDVQININVDDKEEVQLLLEDITVVNEEVPFITVENGEKVYITVQQGTRNNITVSLKEDAEEDAAIYSEVDLSINGSGELTISGQIANGITSKKRLKIYGTKLVIDAEKHALEGKDSLILSGADIELTAGKDGFHSDLDLTILSGIYKLNTQGEGMEAQRVEIHGGEIYIESQEDGINASETIEDEPVYISISGGIINIDAMGEKSDGLDSNGDIFITGGQVYAASTTSVIKHTALDYDGVGSIDGGIFIGTGSPSEVIQNFGDQSTQSSIMEVLDDWVTGELQLLDATGEEILSYTPPRKYQGITISLPEIQQGESYILIAGAYEIPIDLISKHYQ